MAKSAIEKAYDKERARITRFVREAGKRGYTWDKPLLPPKPKRITEASVRRLKGITADKAYEKARYTDPATGDQISGLRGRQRERTAAAQRAAATRKIRTRIPEAPQPPEGPWDAGIRDEGEHILDTILEELGQWEPDAGWSSSLTRWKTDQVNQAQNIILGAIEELGRDVVARNCEANAMELHAIIDRIMTAYGKSYSSAQPDLIRIAAIVRQQPMDDMTNEEMTDYLDSIFDDWT